MQIRALSLLSVAMAWFIPALACAAEFKFASVISDHAVLQRDVEAPVWGFAETGTVVRVTLFKEGDDKPVAERTATTDDNGRWTVKLPAMPPGGPYRIEAALNSRRGTEAQRDENHTDLLTPNGARGNVRSVSDEPIRVAITAFVMSAKLRWRRLGRRQPRGQGGRFSSGAPDRAR